MERLLLTTFCWLKFRFKYTLFDLRRLTQSWKLEVMLVLLFGWRRILISTARNRTIRAMLFTRKVPIVIHFIPLNKNPGLHTIGRRNNTQNNWKNSRWSFERVDAVCSLQVFCRSRRRLWKLPFTHCGKYSNTKIPRLSCWSPRS